MGGAIETGTDVAVPQHNCMGGNFLHQTEAKCDKNFEVIIIAWPIPQKNSLTDTLKNSNLKEDIEAKWLRLYKYKASILYLTWE